MHNQHNERPLMRSLHAEVIEAASAKELETALNAWLAGGDYKTDSGNFTLITDERQLVQTVFRLAGGKYAVLVIYAGRSSYRGR